MIWFLSVSKQLSVSRSPLLWLTTDRRHSLARSRANPFLSLFSSSGSFWWSSSQSCCWYSSKSSLKTRWVQSGGLWMLHGNKLQPRMSSGRKILKYPVVSSLKMEGFHCSCSSGAACCAPELRWISSTTQSPRRSHSSLCRLLAKNLWVFCWFFFFFEYSLSSSPQLC